MRLSKHSPEHRQAVKALTTELIGTLTRYQNELGADCTQSLFLAVGITGRQLIASNPQHRNTILKVYRNCMDGIILALEQNKPIFHDELEQ